MDDVFHVERQHGDDVDDIEPVREEPQLVGREREADDELQREEHHENQVDDDERRVWDHQVVLVGVREHGTVQTTMVLTEVKNMK